MKKILHLTILLFTTFLTAQIANQPADVVICSNNASGISCDFDLTTQIPTIIGTQNPADFTVSFYLTNADAINNIGAINPVGFCNTVNPQTIFARLEDNTSGAFDITSFDLLVSQTPVLANDVFIAVCDDDAGGSLNDGISTFDLSFANAPINQGNASLTINYYASEADLLNDIPIPSIYAYQNIENPQIIYAKATNLEGCTNSAPLELRVNPQTYPVSNSPLIYACDDDMDGFSIVNLTQLAPPFPFLSIEFYENLSDDGVPSNQISNPSNYAANIMDADANGNVTVYIYRFDLISRCISYIEVNILVNCDVRNRVTGNVIYDFDANGCDVSDYPAQNLRIETTNGTDTYNTFTQSDGSYVLLVGEGSYTTSITATGLANSFTATPSSITSNFTGVGNQDTADFCLTQANVTNDLTISVYPLNAARPGFDVSYRIVYSNQGTTLQSGTIVFEFDNTKLQFLTASETTSATTSNSLTFDYTNLIPLESKIIDVHMNVFTPPTTNIDDELIFSTIINPVTGDVTENNNTASLNQIVIGSFDPNDIQVAEGPEVPIDHADKYLHYIIRFQNTGTASAINVHVDNVLDDKLDWSTMQLESLSHQGRVEIKNGNEISFIFDDINLADSTSDEPNSHGFITYKIKPKSNVILGDIVANAASIFFDFNPQIVTNTVTTEFVEPLSVADVNINTFEVFPNPSSDELYIKGEIVINTITIYDINGKKVQFFPIKHDVSSTRLDITELPQGFYFVDIKTDKGREVQKIVKK